METPTLVLVVALLALAAALYYQRAQPESAPQRRAAWDGVRTVVVPRSSLLAANEARPSAFAPAMVGSSAMSAGTIQMRAAPRPAYARTSATTGVRY